MQLYFNSISILERVKAAVVFAEGDNHDFIRSVENIIKEDYYKYDRTYRLSTKTNREVGDPMIIVEKEAVDAAWIWYEHHLNIAAKLFTIDPDSPVNQSLRHHPHPHTSMSEVL